MERIGLFARSEQTCCPVVELRQYTLHPGKRDDLIELFDREFIESQESVGIRVIGQFRDLDDPNRFVWLRGFRDMPSRAEALKDFYGGAVWKAHREAANATMIDFDDVLLLRPTRPSSGFSIEESNRRPPGAKEIRRGTVVAAVYHLDAPAKDDLIASFERAIILAVTAAGGSVQACFVTENSENNFPALPVREDENVLVWFSSFVDEDASEEYVAIARAPQWEGRVSLGPPEMLRLSPTARSLLDGSTASSFHQGRG